MITTNIIERTYLIRYGSGTGTAFTLDLDSKQYLVTAQHVLKGIKDEDVIEIFHEGTWKRLRVNLCGIARDDIDIVVVSPEVQLSPPFELEPTLGGIIFGQDVYFLGFPYGLKSEYENLFRNFPVPLVKKGCLSAIIGKPTDRQIILIDGFNNPGFSGGPVVFRNPANPTSPLKVLGVISGYRFSTDPTYFEDDKAPFTVRSNTGIIICHGICHAEEIISKNPNGIELRKE